MDNEPPIWREWMRAAQGGDRQSYAHLLRAVIPPLSRAARARWPRASAVDIEDVVQETLMALHAARHLYDPARPVLPFLLGILRFRGTDVIRRRQRTVANEISASDSEETFVTIPTNPGQEVAANDTKLREAIARLPRQQRQALELMKLQELSLQEASSVTGMTVAALKVATHRAIQTLRRRLGGDS